LYKFEITEYIESMENQDDGKMDKITKNSWTLGIFCDCSCIAMIKL